LTVSTAALDLLVTRPPSPDQRVVDPAQARGSPGHAGSAADPLADLQCLPEELFRKVCRALEIIDGHQVSKS